jgi:hypothetical protein
VVGEAIGGPSRSIALIRMRCCKGIFQEKWSPVFRPKNARGSSSAPTIRPAGIQ